MINWYEKVYHFNQYNFDVWVEEQASLIPPTSRVLDVGAGAGRYRLLFQHCEYYTQDFCQEPTTIGKYTDIDYISDIIAIPVNDASFDVILCTAVLEHVPEPVQAVKEMARILRQGGKLLLTAPLVSFLHQEPYHFYGGYTPYWFKKFLPEAGFEIDRISANRGFFSLFGQEANRFHALITPWRLKNQGALVYIGMSMLWLITLPFLRGIFPLLGGFLDQLNLEHTATVGYFVSAIKR
ncbi:MAG: class I SAM-dependent methyltransferase [Deltaproteobacteria bacterium]|jgi:SAM-dependent methyltransferase